MDGNLAKFYRSGIFNAMCKGNNHSVVAVGYGNQDGRDYWLIRNSWGEDGYMRVAVNDSNKVSCFVAFEVFQPIFF